VTDSPFALLVYVIFCTALGLVTGRVLGYVLGEIVIALVDTAAYVQNLWRSRD